MIETWSKVLVGFLHVNDGGNTISYPLILGYIDTVKMSSIL